MYPKILEILKMVREDIDFENADGLITEELLDSFDIIAIVARLMDEFQIEIDVEDISVENFDSVSGICRLVEEKAES